MLAKKKILIGLLEHMGDIVACEPVARLLKSKYKNSEITWVSRPIYNDILRANPYIDKIINLECMTDWIKLSKHQNNDLLIDLHVNYRECECCQIPLVKNKGNLRVSIHNWYNYGSLLNAFSIGAGLEPSNDHPNVYIQEKDLISVNNLCLPKKFIVIHRASKDSSRDWTFEKWRQLIQFITKDLEYNIVEIGEKGQGFQEIKKNNYINLCGKTTTLETAEIIKRSSLFIGVDSGPAHLANAVKTPSVILLGTYKNFKKYMPYSGFFSSETKKVKIVRNVHGSANQILLQDVVDAINYVLERPDSGLHYLADEHSVEYILRNEDKKNINEDYVKTIAFYLPQFYPIQENNDAWGDGFVEWSSLIKAKPIFEGHKQPIEPGILGYYDLRSKEVLFEQINLAIEHGINAFCFYYYYSAGKRILAKPLANFLASNVNFKFCLNFANHNWTKKWDAGSQDIIFEQIHNDFDDKFFIKNLIDIFKDDRYIKINDCPLLLIFMPQLIPDVRARTDLWRSELKKHGFKGLYLVAVDDWDSSFIPNEYGFDASYEMPSNSFNLMTDLKSTYSSINPNFSGKIINYNELKNYFISRPFPSYKRFKTVMAPWDNTPRYDNRAIITLANSDREFEDWILNSYFDTYLNFPTEERFIFIHSWNEWAEGTSIEPDKINGLKRLLSVKSATDKGRRIIDMLANDKDIKNKKDGVESLSSLIDMLREKDEAIYRLNKIYGPNQELINYSNYILGIINKYFPHNSIQRKFLIKLKKIL